MSKVRSLVYDRSSRALVVLRPVAWFLLHLYAARPLLGAAASAGVARWIAWSVVATLPFISILPFGAGHSGNFRQRSLKHWVGYATMSFLSLLLVLVLGSDAFRLLQWTVRLVAPGFLLVDPRTLSLAVVAGAVLLALIGLFEARRPRIRRVRVPIDNLPSELHGYRIAQLSDVHVGPTIGRKFVRSIVERTNAESPDLIAITGDLVDAHVADVGEHVEPLSELRSVDGVFYVTGNHEYYWRASEWIPRLQGVGLEFLKNDHQVVARGEARLAVAGVTDQVGRYTHKQSVARALDGVPEEAITILLSHRPQTAAAASRGGVHLQLSGHTHGGQFFPFNLIIRFFQPIVAGLHRVESTWLYVNRGTGYWGPPSRLGVGGEITILELTPA